MPGQPTVYGFVQPRAALRRVGPLPPQDTGPWRERAEHSGSEDDVGRVCRAGERSDAGLVVDIQCLHPVRAAVCRAEDATRIALGLEKAAQRPDEDEVGVAGVNQDRRDLLGALETDATPAPSG